MIRAKGSIHKHTNINSRIVYGDISDKEQDLCFVIPTYNRTTTIKRAIDSILNQAYYNLSFQIFVVDNNPEESEEMDNIVASFDSSKVVYFKNQKNIGMYGNFNRCIELANANWVAMLHDDDVICDDYFFNVKKVLEAVEKIKNVAYIKTTHQLIHGFSEEIVSMQKQKHSNYVVNHKHNLTRISKLTYSLCGIDRIGEYGTPSCGVLYNKSIFLECGGFDEDLYPTEDSFYVERLVCQKGYKAYKTIGVFGYYVFENNESLSQKTIEGFALTGMRYYEYAKSRDYLSKIIYKLFDDEIRYEYCAWLKQLIDNNPRVVNPVELIDHIDDVYKHPKCRKWHLRIYKYINRVYQIIQKRFFYI